MCQAKRGETGIMTRIGGGTIGRPMREKVFLAAACFILLILAAAFIVHFVVP